MSTYNPDIAIYYGPIDSDHRLIPAPEVSISVEYQYSNDTIIGYTYIFNITGAVTALDLRDLNYGDPYPEPSLYNTGAIADHIYKLRQILSQNGNILHIVNATNNNIIIKARGGILRSLSIDESPNNWVHSANYSASIEFQSVDFGSNTEGCDNLFLDPVTYASGTYGIVDINKYKIKEFNDSWSFSFEDPDAYSRIYTNEKNMETLEINNTSFNISYSISATGKHYYIYDDETTGNEKRLLPAWEQAKNFVQERLYYQVTNLINGILKASYSGIGCTSDDTLRTINDPITSEEGLLSYLGDGFYKVFNETITCEASESDGTFSATYNAIVKSTTFSNSKFTTFGTKHTINKSVNKTRNGSTFNTTISVNGTIQGLIEGGIIRSPTPIALPANGYFLIAGSGFGSKYGNAKLLLDKIFKETDYDSGIGDEGKRDLIADFKKSLGITAAELGLSAVDPDDNVQDFPHPSSFNLTHDYHNGTINYSLEYNSNSLLGRKYREISIQTTLPVPVLATFNIPNSASCPLIQNLGTTTAKTINVTVQGVDLSNVGQPNLSDFNLVDIVVGQAPCAIHQYLPIGLPDEDNMIKTAQSFNYNPVDGSYTLNLTYICGTEGCALT